MGLGLVWGFHTSYSQNYNILGVKLEDHGVKLEEHNIHGVKTMCVVLFARSLR